jgi:hypothetical protein
MENLIVTIIAGCGAVWVLALLAAGKDEPLEINARDRYKNTRE